MFWVVQHIKNILTFKPGNPGNPENPDSPFRPGVKLRDKW